MTHNRWGVHWSNVPIGEQLGKWALGMGGDCYLVIDGGYGWIPKIREARPNAIIVHRHAVSNWMDMEPEDWAYDMSDLLEQHAEYDIHAELECEPDIFPNFPGWGEPIVDRLKFAADWNGRVAEELRRLWPSVVIHSPPLAHERLDLPQWFEIWKPVLDVCDALDMHCYWEIGGKYHRRALYDPEESYHRAFRYRKIHDFLTEQNYHIPMMVTECGNFAPDNPNYADELTYYFSELEKDADYMIGGCVFILKSNQWNRVNDLTRQPNIEAFFRRLGQAPKKDLPYPNFPRTGKMPDSGKKEPEMGIWKDVPENIAQWRPLIEKVTSSFHVPIPDYNGIPVSPAKVVTCIIRIESNGDPKAVGGAGHAHGLMQVWKDHHPGKNLFDPEVNIRTGLEILKAKLDISRELSPTGANIYAGIANLRDALYFYSGGTAWSTIQGYIEKYWQPFVKYYKQFWGIDLEPKSNDRVQDIINKATTIRKLAESIEEDALEL